ncbi:MAG: phage head morphogenesis protein [Candidatus Thiodiazotropha endolucinida]|nr:phage head morphogenesis protein [Candidatus Thiodiazotropha taylori]MCW4321589.1 phage head morphogenesis protein [Candidatus Thiodiazotropha taylori]
MKMKTKGTPWDETRHQVMLEQLKAAEANEVISFLSKILHRIKLKLTSEDVSSLNKTKLKALLKDIRGLFFLIYDKYYDHLSGLLIDVIELELNVVINEAIAAGATTETKKTLYSSLPSPEQLLVAVKNTPFHIQRSRYVGMLLEPLLRDLSKNLINQILGTVSMGYYEGLTTQQIVTSIVGSKALNYKDGLGSSMRRATIAIVRTSIQHVAMQTRTKVFSKTPFVKKYQWVSTLDLRTSQPCRALDGETFVMGDGPVPPIHIGCRSSIIPIYEGKEFKGLEAGRKRAARTGPEPANKQYYEWLSEQSAETQDEVLGPTLGKLFRQNGMTPEKFRKLSLDRKFHPLTIADLKSKHPDLWN